MQQRNLGFFMCDLFNKYAPVVPLKNKKSIAIAHTFQNILNSSKRKRRKMWVDQVSESYSNFLKKG